MKSQTNLKEIIKFYQINDSRYNWQSQPLINLIQEIQNRSLSVNIYAKAYKTNLELSSTNGFISRPKTKMITVQLDRKKNLLNVFHRLNFFDYDGVSSKEFRMDEISSITNSIFNWIN